MRATLFPARFAGAEYGCSLLDWLSRLMSSYELCKKNACDAPQCPEMCRPRTCRKRPIGANRTGLEMTATGYDTCIQYTVFQCSLVCHKVFHHSRAHWSCHRLQALVTAGASAEQVGACPSQARAAVQPADGLLQIWERCKYGEYTMCSDHDR